MKSILNHPQKKQPTSLEEVVTLSQRPDGNPMLVPAETDPVQRRLLEYHFGPNKVERRPITPKHGRRQGPLPTEALALLETAKGFRAGITAELSQQRERKAQLVEQFLGQTQFDDKTRLSPRRLLVLAKNLAEESPSKSSLLAYAFLEHLYIDDSDEEEPADPESEREFAETLQETDEGLIRFVARIVREQVFEELNIPQPIAKHLDGVIVCEIIHGRIDYLKTLIYQGIQSILSIQAADTSTRQLADTFSDIEEERLFDPDFDIESFPATYDEPLSEHTRQKLAKLLGPERAEEIISAVESQHEENRHMWDTITDRILQGPSPDGKPEEPPPPSLPTTLSEEDIQAFWREMDQKENQ